MVRHLIAGVLFAVSLPLSATSQSFSSEPIAFDVDDTAGDAGTPLLIAAYEPPAGTAPQIGAAGANRAAAVTQAGLPAPSIILGRIEPGREADFGISILLPETVATMRFDFDDLETRVAMRGEDPEMFRKLIEQGHIDPPAERLNAALQLELQRMNCYRSTIDGLWGPGSRRSVGGYFDAREDALTWPDQEPSMELFRAIILYPDVECVVQQPTPRATTQTTTPRTTTTRTMTARPAPAPAPSAPATTSNRPRISTGGGIGVFR